MKIYLSGPMSGYPNYNTDAFNAAAENLRKIGHDVINPVEIKKAEPTDWEGCMREDIRAMMDADAVATLPGWQASRGARIEVTLAKQLGMPVEQVTSFLCIEEVAS